MIARTKIARNGMDGSSIHTVRAEDHAGLVARKVRDLRHYDVLGMEDVVAIAAWGRSASLLLASFLDGHDHVLMLPGLHSERIWQFLERHPDLPLKDRLLAFPGYSEEQGRPFFYGDFIVPEADYRAAVDALFQVYDALPAALSRTRRVFFQFLSAAYGLAQGLRPATPRPLMVYAQHNWNATIAANLVEDFPKARFLHTVRHPIACFRSSVERQLALAMADGQVPQPVYFKPVLTIVNDLATWDRPHPGMAERTRAVRFEDMHLRPRETMRSVADWLGLPWHPSLEASTFSGIPYLMERGDSDWVGVQPTQTQDPFGKVSYADRTLLFALFHENFVAWNYPHPAVFRFGWLRRAVVAAFRAVPMSMELMAARASLRVQVGPAYRSGAYGFMLRLAARWVTTHGAAVRLARTEIRRRVGGKWGAPSWLGGAVPGVLPMLQPVVAKGGPSGAAIAGPVLPRDEAGCVGRLVSAVLDRSGVVDADLVGQAASLLDPIARLIRDHVFAAEALHAADMPVPLVTVGPHGRTQARVWAYVRDERPFHGPAAPAVALFFSSDRRPEHRQDHLHGFQGFLQTHAGPAFERAAGAGDGALGPVVAVACWGRCRLKFCEVLEFTGASQAEAALRRIADIEAIERRARAVPRAKRIDLRIAARPLVERFFAWAETVAGTLDPTSMLAGAFRHTLARRDALSWFLDHGCLEFDNAATQPVLARLPWYAEAWTSPSGGQGHERAMIHSVFATARLNGLDEEAYLRDVLGRLQTPRRNDRLERLLPWHWAP